MHQHQVARLVALRRDRQTAGRPQSDLTITREARASTPGRARRGVRISSRPRAGTAAPTETSAPARCPGEGSADKDRDGRPSPRETSGRRDSSDTTSGDLPWMTSQREAAAPPLARRSRFHPPQRGRVERSPKRPIRHAGFITRLVVQEPPVRAARHQSYSSVATAFGSGVGALADRPPGDRRAWDGQGTRPL